MIIRLLLIAVLFVSCTAQEDNYMPEVYYTDVNVHVEFETTYKDVNISIYDVDNQKYIYQGIDVNLNMDFPAKYRARYKFIFERTSDAIDPYVRINIKNTTTNKVIDDYENKGCTLGYSNSFIAW
jgi:hypothetical protein